MSKCDDNGLAIHFYPTNGQIANREEQGHDARLAFYCHPVTIPLFKYSPFVVSKGAHVGLAKTMLYDGNETK
jgi:hypothetical protein